MRLIAIALCLVACSRAKPEVQTTDPPAAVTKAFDDGIPKLKAHLDGPYVVSRDGDPHVGEAVIWSMWAAAALPCVDGAPIIDALADQMLANGGAVARYSPLPDDYKEPRLNFDGETGLEFGFSIFAVRCPSLTGKLRQAWAAHRAMLESSGWEVYPGTGITMPEGFRFTAKMLDATLGLAPAPKVSELVSMENEAEAWVSPLHLTKGACYPVNLSWMHLYASEVMGADLSRGRDLFCAATRGMGIPNIEDWCGRADLADWIDGYKYGEWEMRFQRCAEPWESPDGHGEDTPNVDLLEAIRLRYKVRS